MNAPTIKHPQHILAIDTSYLHDKLGCIDGVNSVDFGIFFEGANEHLAIRRRHELESNEDYLQILPYVIVAKGDITDPKNLKLSAYYRPASGGESRLHGNLSIGYGGHIDLIDIVVTDKSVIDFPETIKRSMRRELQEEIGITDELIEATENYTYALITDKSNSVGRVHLGVVYAVVVPASWQPSADVSEIDLAGDFTAAELLAKEATGEIVMENWTKLLAQTLAR